MSNSSIPTSDRFGRHGGEIHDRIVVRDQRCMGCFSDLRNCFCLRKIVSRLEHTI